MPQLGDVLSVGILRAKSLDDHWQAVKETHRPVDRPRVRSMQDLAYLIPWDHRGKVSSNAPWYKLAPKEIGLGGTTYDFISATGLVRERLVTARSLVFPTRERLDEPLLSGPVADRSG